VGIFKVSEKQPTATVSEKGVREYTRKFLVQMEFLGDIPPLVWDAGLLSISRYDPYPGDLEALAVSLDCAPHGDQLGFYDLSFKYTTKPFDFGNTSHNPAANDQSVAPTSRPWVLKIGSTHGQRVLGPQDLNGKAVVNSSGQPFNPPIEVISSCLTLTISAYGPITLDPIQKQLMYEDSTNSSALTIPGITTTTFPIQSLRCTEYNAETETENGQAYWKIDVSCEYKPTTWVVSILDAGTMYFKSNSLPPQPILDASGNPIQVATPLNGMGQPLSVTDILAGNFKYINFKGYNTADFTQLFS